MCHVPPAHLDIYAPPTVSEMSSVGSVQGMLLGRICCCALGMMPDTSDRSWRVLRHLSCATTHKPQCHFGACTRPLCQKDQSALLSPAQASSCTSQYRVMTVWLGSQNLLTMPSGVAPSRWIALDIHEALFSHCHHLGCWPRPTPRCFLHFSHCTICVAIFSEIILSNFILGENLPCLSLLHCS